MVLKSATLVIGWVYIEEEEEVRGRDCTVGSRGGGGGGAGGGAAIETATPEEESKAM